MCGGSEVYIRFGQVFSHINSRNLLVSDRFTHSMKLQKQMRQQGCLIFCINITLLQDGYQDYRSVLSIALIFNMIIVKLNCNVLFLMVFFLL